MSKQNPTPKPTPKPVKIPLRKHEKPIRKGSDPKPLKGGGRPPKN